MRDTGVEEGRQRDKAIKIESWRDRQGQRQRDIEVERHR